MKDYLLYIAFYNTYIDYMFVDMPPGTGDVPLTVFQSLPLDGILIVTSPQELVGMIVEKAANMADMMDVPVLGIIENMSYFKCDQCGKQHYIFGESHLEEIGDRVGIGEIARLPIDPVLSAACDAGNVEKVESTWLNDIADMIKTVCLKMREKSSVFLTEFPQDIDGNWILG